MSSILYPIFFECCIFCVDDVFWSSVFENLALGKPPNPLYLNKGYLCCNIKDKEISYKIDATKSSEVIYKEVRTLLSEKLEILSTKDRLQKRLEFNKYEDDISKNLKFWNNINKHTKSIHYEKYVLEMKHLFSLTMKQTKSLLSLIYTLITFKYITNKNIVYNNGKIQKIEGVEIVAKKGCCPPKNIFDKLDIDTNKKQMSKIQRIDTFWPKYLASLQK